MTLYDKICITICLGCFWASFIWFFAIGLPQFQSFATVGEVPTKLVSKFGFVILVMIASKVIHSEIFRKYP